MAPMIYTVTAIHPDRATADEFVAWLVDGHAAAVIAGGAASATVTRIDPPDAPVNGGGGSVTVEVRYLFPSREAFARYEAEHAEALRAEGRERFGGRGVTFARWTGERVAELA